MPIGIRVFLCLLPVLLVSGCNDEPITFHQSVPVTRDITRSMGGSEDGEPKYRMITAIVNRTDAMWFFKLTGPIANMDPIKQSWAEFLDSVTFESPEPTWSLPESWTSSGFEDRPMPGGMAMRIANVATSDKEVTVSVSSMPAGQQILPNVNRWRGQLGLGPTDSLQLATQLTQLKNETVEFKVFEADGPQLTTRMGGGAPFAGRDSGRPKSPHAGMGARNDLNPSTPATKPPFVFSPPVDWQTGKTSSMIMGNWNKDTEQGPVVMKLLTMNPTDESWELNVEAFARQVKISPPSVNEVTETVDVAGSDARSVNLAGPDIETPDENPAVRAVLFENAEGDGYMLVLSGNETAVKSAFDDFQSLLKSIKFESTDG